METDYVMSFTEFADFLQQYSPNTYIPEGFYLAPLAALHPRGYNIWLVSKEQVDAMQRGV